MNFQTTVPCPDCGQHIPIGSALLLQGASFKCPNAQCGVSISLDAASVSQVQQAYEQLEELKQTSIQEANQQSPL